MQILLARIHIRVVRFRFWYVWGELRDAKLGSFYTQFPEVRSRHEEPQAVGGRNKYVPQASQKPTLFCFFLVRFFKSSRSF